MQKSIRHRPNVCVWKHEKPDRPPLFCVVATYWPEPHSIANLCQFSSIYRAVDFACLNIVSLSHHHLPLLNAVVILFVIVRIINKPIYALFLLFTWWFVTASFSNRYCVLCIDLFERTKQETTTNVNAWSEQKKKLRRMCGFIYVWECYLETPLGTTHTHMQTDTRARDVDTHAKYIYIFLPHCIYWNRCGCLRSHRNPFVVVKSSKHHMMMMRERAQAKDHSSRASRC